MERTRVSKCRCYQGARGGRLVNIMVFIHSPLLNRDGKASEPLCPQIQCPRGRERASFGPGGIAIRRKLRMAPPRIALRLPSRISRTAFWAAPLVAALKDRLDSAEIRPWKRANRRLPLLANGN